MPEKREYIKAINVEIGWCEKHKSYAMNVRDGEISPEKCRGFIEGLKQAKRLIRKVDREINE